MEAHDFDVLARVVGSACTRRHVVRTIGAAFLLAIGGGRARFDAQAADLGCCKCSGTRRCEDDVSSYGECKQLCGTKTAIFSPNHSCEPGQTVSKLCKLKRQAGTPATETAVLTSDLPGLYDLAYFDAAASTVLGEFTREHSTFYLTAEAAIEGGFVREQGAAELFDGGVQIFNGFNRLVGSEIGVINLISQHASVESASAWVDYARPQLWPPEAEDLSEEGSGLDSEALARFQFPSTEAEGDMVTRITGISRIGEFVNWFIMDGIETPPDSEMAKNFQQAVADAIVSRPDQTGSLAPYIFLPEGSGPCIPGRPDSAARKGSARAFLFQEQGFCDPPKIDVAYPLLDGVYRARTGTPVEAIDATKVFYQGARTVLTYTYQYGSQQRTVTVTWWEDHAPIQNGGEGYFERVAALDALRGVRREVVPPEDGGIVDPAFSSFAFNVQNGAVYGVERTYFYRPFSISMTATEPGVAIPDITDWNPTDDAVLRSLLDREGAQAGNEAAMLDRVRAANSAQEAIQYAVWEASLWRPR